MKKYIIPSSIVLLIVVGVLFVNFKNTSDEISVTTIIQKEEEIKTEIEIKTNTGEIDTTEILAILEEQLAPEVIEESIAEIVVVEEPEIEIKEEVPEPVVVSVPKIEPKITTIEPDFQPDEYYQRSEDIAPIIHNYEPKPEWFIPDGNPEEFSMDNLKELNNAFGKNYKNLSISINRSYIGSEITNFTGFTKLIQQYTNKSFYFVGDNEEEQGLWRIHIELTPGESIKLMEELKNDNKIDRVRQMSDVLPEFQDQRDEIIRKNNDFSIL